MACLFVVESKNCYKKSANFSHQKKLFLAVLFKELLKKSFVLHPEK